MAYTLDNLRTDIRNYTEVGSNVLSDTVLERIIKNAELKNGLLNIQLERIVPEEKKARLINIS